MEHGLMLVAATILIFYMLLKKRPFDFLSIYTISLIWYCGPVWLGKVSNPYTKELEPAEPKIFLVYTIAFFFLFFVLLITDAVSSKKEKGFDNYKIVKSKSGEGSPLFVLLLFLICLFIFARVIPVYLASFSKALFVSSVGFQYMVLMSLSVIGFVYCLVYRLKAWMVIFFIINVAIFLIGSRSPIVFCVLSFLVFVGEKKRRWMSLGFKNSIILTFFALITVFGKSFYSIWGYGDGSVSSWLSSLSIEQFMMGAESASSSLILNEVLERSYDVPFWSVPASFLSMLPIPLSYFGLQSSMFNEFFQTDLFGSIDYGMASSPWAEAYSWLSWAGVVIFSVAIPSALSILYRLSDKVRKKDFYVILIVLGVVLAFWVHRNSVGTILGYMRNYFYPYFFLLLASALFARVLRGGR